MALIPGFERDVFISYARVDNKANSLQGGDWIKNFHNTLEILLDAKHGRSGVVKLWYDKHEIDEATDFSDSIRDGIKESAVMICINSKGYKVSPWCTKERSEFVKKAQNEGSGLKVGLRKRIINICLNNIPYTEWPDELDGMEGFKFYEAEGKDDEGYTVTPDNKKLWNRKLLRVRDVVYKILENMLEEYKSNEPSPEVEDSTKTDAFSIYLAEVSDTLRSSRKRLGRELEKQGYQVMINEDTLQDAETHKTSTLAFLQKADLSIHLMDQIEGREIAGATDSYYIQKEAEIAFGVDIPQIIWVPNELSQITIEEESYKDFILGLDQKRPDKTYDFIKGVKNNLNQVIKDLISSLRDNKSQKQMLDSSDGNGPLKVLLDYQVDDDNFARNLSNTFADHNITAYFAPSAEDPKSNDAKFKDRLLKSQKFVFLCGESEVERTISRVESTLKKANSLDRFNIGKDMFVYLIPPEKKEGVIPPDKYPINIVNKSDPSLVGEEIVNQIIKDLKET